MTLEELIKHERVFELVFCEDSLGVGCYPLIFDNEGWAVKQSPIYKGTVQEVVDEIAGKLEGAPPIR